jgi:hypothetical protein
LYAFLILPMRATCPAYVILLELITLMVYGEAYKLWSSSLCSLIQPPTTSSILGSNSVSAPCQTPPVYVLPLVWETKFHTHTTQQVKLVLYVLIFKFLKRRREDMRCWTE